MSYSRRLGTARQRLQELVAVEFVSACGGQNYIVVDFAASDVVKVDSYEFFAHFGGVL
jgi:hypothetical protein